MEFACNLGMTDVHPGNWGRQRELEGWDVLTVADHHWMEVGPSPHVFVTLGIIAEATTQARLATGFANNLFRSPVEFAQAALTLQAASGGRFEAGLGAGWSADEMVRRGDRFPEAKERADRYIEAVQVVRELLHTGSSRFGGRYYRIDVDGLGPLAPVPPPLVVSVGGPRTIAGAVPHADRVEIKPASSATRNGRLDLRKLFQITTDRLVELIGQVRAVNADVPIAMHVLCRSGYGAEFEELGARMSPDSLFGRFFGDAHRVAEAILGLGELGIDRVQLSPGDQGTFDVLQSLLLRPVSR